MTWIARHVELIEDLWTYMDDSFGIDEEGNVLWYHKYEKYMPANQVKLLSLWDDLGISARTSQTKLWLNTHHYRNLCQPEQPDLHPAKTGT